MDQTLYVVQGTSPCGTRLTTGPFDIGEAITVVDQAMLPGGWAPKYLQLTPVPDAHRVFAVGHKTPHPVPGKDLFVALRRAIFTDPDNDGIECPRAGAIVAYLEAHRPLPMYHGDEECLLSECSDARGPDGLCVELRKGEPLCVACSAYYDSGTEWGPEWIEDLRVTWPCAPICNAVRRYNVELLTEEVDTHA